LLYHTIMRDGKTIIAAHLTDANKTLFWSKVEIKGEDECWPWRKGCTTGGYGQFHVNRKAFLAHRVAMALQIGHVEGDVQVLHSCERSRRCCNPKHLRIGTHDDNMDDRNRAGGYQRGDSHYSRLHPERLARGERHGTHTHPERVTRGDNHWVRTHPEKVRKGAGCSFAKLTEEDVREIRKLAGKKQGLALAIQFGVSTSTISGIVNRKSWKWLDDE
jgi:hypothetical protein